jgi:hypothetical protein
MALSIIFVFLCCAVGFFLSAYVIVDLWAVFVVPATGLSKISIVQCMGLCLVLRYILKQEGRSWDETTKDKSLSWVHAYIFGKSILNPLFVWLVGTIIASFL